MVLNSLPEINLEMLALWRQAIKHDRATVAIASQRGRVSATRIGKQIQPIREPIEAFLKTRVTIMKATKKPSAKIGYKTERNPAVVATPLPPLSRRVTGRTCPSTAATPRAHPPGRPPTAKPREAAIAPFMASAISTMSPARQPSMRLTFEAPGLPEPSAVTSCPPALPTMTAVGKVPRK